MGVQRLESCGKDDLDDLGPALKVYELSATTRAQLIVSGVFFTIVCLLLAVVGVTLALVSRQYVGCIPALVGFLLMIRFLRATSFEITVDPTGTICFRSWLRSQAIPAGEIVSVTTGGWVDPHRLRATIRHKGGRLILHNHFLDFWHFLATLKSFNPAIEIKGF